MDGMAARSRCRVLLVDSDPWRREGIAALLSARGFLLVPDAPNVALVNLSRRAAEAAETVEALKKQWPELRVVGVVNEIAAHTVFPALVMGIHGVLAYDAKKEEIVASLRAVAGGSIWVPRGLLESWVERVVAHGVRSIAVAAPPPADPSGVFTRSQWRILEALDEELSNKQIALRLNISETTVKFHVGQLLRKTGAKSRRELARIHHEIVARGMERIEEQAPALH